MSNWCAHQGTVTHWEKGPKIRDEKDRDGNVIATWYKWYQVCDACGQSIRFESRQDE